ncbi:MAG TPA: NUDIX hydrolase [Gaiellaceae bacterium]|nr:NUDIX hydrolase [Gaiellaceae bacterium]
MADPLRAAGGLVERDGRVLVVHRPKYDDWAFPKGKLEDGESWEDAAVREVEEETALRCELGGYVGSTHYPIREGTKEVRYYRLRADGEPRAQNEIDELRWVTPAEAEELLSYDYDRELLKLLR